MKLIFSEFKEGGCVGKPKQYQYFITQKHNGEYFCHWDGSSHDTLLHAQEHGQRDFDRVIETNPIFTRDEQIELMINASKRHKETTDRILSDPTIREILLK